MQSLLITPKDQAELDFLVDLLARLNIVMTVLDDEDKEDAGLSTLPEDFELKNKKAELWSDWGIINE